MRIVIQMMFLMMGERDTPYEKLSIIRCPPPRKASNDYER